MEGPINANEKPAQAVIDLNKIPRAPETRLVWTSSVVMMPPKDLWGPFVEIKKNHMNPRIKRPPFPHITILAPFVEYRQFSEAASYLRKQLEAVEPFKLEFNVFELFMNGGSNTLYLDPVVTPKNGLQNVYDIATRVYPQCVNSKNEEGGFEPHIGVGYFKNKAEALALQAKYQKDWKPMVFTCQEVYCLSRVGEGPFVVRAVISLGRVPNKPLFESIPE